MGAFFLSALIECNCTGASLLASCRVSYYPVSLFTNHTAAQLCQRVNLLPFSFFHFLYSSSSLLGSECFPGPFSNGTLLSSSSECLDLELESTQLFCFHVQIKRLTLEWNSCFWKCFQNERKTLTEWTFLKVSRITWCKYKTFFPAENSHLYVAGDWPQGINFNFTCNENFLLQGHIPLKKQL